MGIFKRLFGNKGRVGKRGMTVGEVIVAIAVIVIVTISAAYTIQMSASATSRDFNYERARIAARNSLEEFKYDRVQSYKEQYGDYTLEVTVEGNHFTAVITYNDESKFEIRYTKYTKGG